METRPARRGSKQKTAVLRAVKLLSNHPTAEEIFFRARKEIPHMSISTVYRNLGILVDRGELVSITGFGSEIHYDHNLTNHCHIQCRKCGKVRDVNFEPIDFVKLLSEGASGFQVDGVCVKFSGICRECRVKLSMKGEQ